MIYPLPAQLHLSPVAQEEHARKQASNKPEIISNIVFSTMLGIHQFKDPTQEIPYVKKLQSKLYVATRHPACDSPYTQSSFCLKEKLRAISSLVYAEEHHLVNPALLSLWQPTQDCWWSRGLVQPVKQPPNSFQTDLTASKLRSTFWPVSHLLDVGGRNKTIWPVEGRFIILRGVMVTNTGA